MDGKMKEKGGRRKEGRKERESENVIMKDIKDIKREKEMTGEKRMKNK